MNKLCIFFHYMIVRFMWAKIQYYSIIMKVNIYTASWKQLERRRAIEFFEQSGIDYNEYDISNDKGALERLMSKTGIFTSFKTMPIIEIGENIIHGFNLRKIKLALNCNNMML